MYIRCSLVAIFIVFILCVHCENGANFGEVKKIYVPSAPQNLTANSVSSEEIHLSWAPPTTFTLHMRRIQEPQADAPLIPDPPQSGKPDISVLPKEQADDPRNDITDIKTDTFTSPEKLKDVEFQTPFKDLYNNDKEKYNNEYSKTDILNDDPNRSRRDLKSHRHRKRRQESPSNATEEKGEPESEMPIEISKPIEVVKKVAPVIPHKNATQIAYVLYYEQGLPMQDAGPIQRIPTSADVKSMNAFASDLGMDEQHTKNLTLLNTAGLVTKVVGFRLRNLKPFTPYKIWVRAFYSFSLDGVKSSDLVERLGPQSEPVYVLTDVRPPSAPIVLNLTCDQTKRILYLQWRQPMMFDNTLDQYVVTLRKLPELQPRSKLLLPTTKDDLETTISVEAELWNVTRYEVKIYAVSLSVAKPHLLVNGTQSPPEEVSSEWCVAHSEAFLPDGRVGGQGVSRMVLLATLPIALLAALAVAAVYWRCRSRLSKCISAAYSYLEEGGERAARAPLNAYKAKVKSPEFGSGAAAGAGAAAAAGRAGAAPRMAPALSRRQFARRVLHAHRDSDSGFSKEYEIVVSQSAASGHTSHYSHRPENRLKNRYLNITAYDHSRVCVSRGGRCGAAGCRGGASPRAPHPTCDYVNANFIDGIKPQLEQEAKEYIKRKLERRRKKPQRQPSVKPVVKPTPNLAEGIESAFLNIEFSGIVESEQEDDSSSDRSDDDELDDVFVDIDGERTQVKLEWLIWRRRYIATQGPTPATLDSFWLMIYQHNVTTVLMITNLVERGRRKCDMYWPSGGRGSSATFGNIKVTLLCEQVFAAYTVRHLKAQYLENGTLSEGRTIVQYHYTMWPDHGTPRHALAVLPFVRCSSRARSTHLVHCSAGVGRTGTYIVLDAQLNQLKLTGTLSPLGFLCRARTQRNHLVQTEEQYIFVHDALLEYVRSGDTAVEITKAREYLVKLLQPITDEELAVLDIESKTKSVNDLSNGYENNETASVKSQVNDSLKSENKDGVCNGDCSESIKTDDVSEKDGEFAEEGEEGSQKGEGEEGVYDLAPRATDTYSKKMAAYNNMSEEEKEEIRRANRAENYAILERMRSLSSRTQQYQGPPPVNQLEKQFHLISRACNETCISGRSAHNAHKNRPGAALPADSHRALLVPKPGLEGSEYVNASWVQGRYRAREYCVSQHPHYGARAELWRLLWDHTAQLTLVLTDKTDEEEEDCEPFWPTEEDKEMYVANFKATFVSKEIYVAHRKCDRKPPTPVTTPTEPETNGYKRQESDCADDERLIPENSPTIDTEPAYRFDRTELRLERLSTGSRDLSTRKSIANGDLFSSERMSGPKSPRSPSKMSLKNFKINSPTKFKFPDWGSRAGSPPETAPPPPPITPSLSVEEEIELRRPCYYFEKVTEVPQSTSSDRIIEVTNVSVHSLQDDYQLNVKFIKCSGWLEGDTCEYKLGKPDENELIRVIRDSEGEKERQEGIDRLIQPFSDSFALIEFIAGCQMEYKNGPVVVVDKNGDWKALTFCALSASCGGVRNPQVNDPSAPYRSPLDSCADLYCALALSARARVPCGLSAAALLAGYAALARYGDLLDS